MSRAPLATSFLCLLLSALLAAPSPAVAQAGQRAGEVQRVIPAVSIERGAQQLAAAAQTPVHWEDTVATGPQGRARIRLDDASVLNVGSESSLRVLAHDPTSQRSELDLHYGRIRSRVVKLAKPGAKYEVRTPVGTAGVIGTDFYLAFLNGIALLIVFEGIVRFCNLAGQCVEVGAGQTSSIQGAAEPTAAVAVTPAASMAAAQSTEVEDLPAHGTKARGRWAAALGFAAVGVAAAIVATRGKARAQGPPGTVNRLP